MKDILGYEGLYAITEQGEVYSYVSKKFKSQHITNVGYKRIELRKDKKGKNFLVHRLVALTYIPNPEGYECVNHKNGIKTDNRLENLEWCSREQNMQHSIKVLNKIPGAVPNTLPYRPDNKNLKLKKEDVDNIRILRAKYKGTELAKMFNVSASTIYNITKYKDRIRY